MRNIGLLLIIIPFILTSLGTQQFFALFFSESITQLFAYTKLAMVVLGSVLLLKHKTRDPLPSVLFLWLIFYALYFGIGLLANNNHNNEAPFLKSFVPVIFFVGFCILLGLKNYRNIFVKVLIIAFTFSNILLIFLNKINFSLDHKGLTDYTLERAGGVYADANNAAVVCLLAFIFIYHLVKPKNILQNIFKLISIMIALYGLFLTFSKTGFLVLLFVLVFTFYKFFKPHRIFLFLIIGPIFIYGVIQTFLNSPGLSVVQKTRIQEVVNIVTFNTSDVSYSGRDYLFQNMLNYINKNPFFGNGVYFSTEIRGHNTIFGIWADSGVFTFILFVTIMVIFIRKALMAPKEIKYFSLSILTVLVLFMFTLQTIIDQVYLLAIFVYLAYLLDNNKEKHVGLSTID